MTRRRPFVIGLTGSIGMGKSTTAALFASYGVPVFCADKVARDLTASDGKAFDKIAKTFPEAITRAAKLNRKKLARLVFSDEKKLKKLERILHPLIWKELAFFLKTARQRGDKRVVLDIPLLFETNRRALCDLTICVTAAAVEQKKRVLKRPGMTVDLLRSIVKKQEPDREKRRRADLVWRTDRGLEPVRKQIKDILRQLEEDKKDA